MKNNLLPAPGSMLPDHLECRAALDAPVTATNEFCYLPAGIVEGVPSQGGRAVRVQLRVDASGAAELERQRAAIVARGDRPFIDFNHNDEGAAFWVDCFFWRDGAGIICAGEWTAKGREAIVGKEYRGFSPVCHVDDAAKRPCRIVCRENAKPNMGGLVNDQAFKAIPPFFAKNAETNLPMWAKAGAHPATTKTNAANDMNEKELAALQAKNQELQQQIADHKAEQSALKAKNESDAIVASQIAAKTSELALNQAKLDNAALTAKNADLEKADLAHREADAKLAVQAAVDRGAIAAKDADTIAAWEKDITENPVRAALLAKMAGNPALGTRITQPAASAARVERGAISGKDAVIAYARVVSENSKITNAADPAKAKLAKEAAAIYAADMKGREDDWMGVSLDDALKGADVTSAAVGTLAGTLVLQRNLPLLAFSYPMLKTMFTDFSDTAGLWQQTEVTRIPIVPAVTEYDATLDANGRPKGFVVVTPAQTVDVPITLSKHVGIPMIFGVQTLASTVRNLFAEQSAGAINALGGYFVDMATALMTAANFNAFKGITETGGATTDGSTTITMTSTAECYKGQPISGTGIPTGAVIASVTDGTTAVITIAATATGSSLTFTLGGGLVPTLYPTYVKAAADFNFASLGEIGAAFDNIRVPYANRCAMLNATYYSRLTQDPTVNNFFAATRSPDIINKGLLPELNGFVPQKAPFFPTSSNRVGFAYHPAAIALKSRIPQDFTRAVSAMVPGSVTLVTDPDTGISVLHVERVDLTGSYAESRIEVMLGAAVGDPRAGMVITSA